MSKKLIYRKTFVNLDLRLQSDCFEIILIVIHFVDSTRELF